MKKAVSIILCVILVVSIASVSFTADAVVAKRSNAEAMAWVKSQVGKSLDYDGEYGAQCVDFIAFYYKYLGTITPGGNGADYSWNKLPSGWKRIKGAQPKVGDILVYVGSQYGHVGIYESDYVTYHQNYSGQHKVVKCTYKYNELTVPYWGVIRPKFTDQDLGAKFYANILVTSKKSLALTSTDKNNVCIDTADYSNYEKWLFKRQNDYSYKITNVKMKKCLDVKGGKTAKGTNIQVYKSNNTNAQRWYLIKNGSGYSFVPKCNYKGAMDIKGGKFEKDNNVQEWNSKLNEAQRFTIVKTVNYKNLGKTFKARIISNKSTFSVDADSSSNVYLNNSNKGSNSQKWLFERQKDMSYKITNLRYKKCLDVKSEKKENGTNIQLWKSNDSKAQRWFIIKNDSGYALVPKCNLNGAMDIKGAKFVKGTNIQEWTINYKEAQRFKISKY